MRAGQDDRNRDYYCMWQTDPVLYRKGTMNDRRKVKAQKQSTFNITILMEARTWLALKEPAFCACFSRVQLCVLLPEVEDHPLHMSLVMEIVNEEMEKYADRNK